MIIALPVLALVATAAQDDMPLTGAAAAREHVLSAGRSDRFAVPLRRGGRLEVTVDQRGIDLAVHILDPAGREVAVIDSPNGLNGPEQVELEPTASGVFTILITSLDAKAPPGRYAITAVRVLSPAAQAARLAMLEMKRKAVRGWLAARALPLDADDSTIAERLAPALHGVDILGLGEGSHGSHELFALKAQFVRALVRRGGFRVLAMELDRVAGEQLDAYVHGRIDTLDPRLKPWDTEEVVALLNWLHDWNRSAAPADQVAVIGIDGQDRASGADLLVAYLRRTAPDQADAVATLVADTTFPTKLDAAAARRTQQGYQDLLIYFDLHATALIVRSSEAEYRAMRDLVQVMAQTGSIYSKDSNEIGVGRRNEYMADNLRRYLDGVLTGTKVILWAHNGHVEATSRAYPPTGYYLRRLYGPRYYALGSTFAEGEYQAWTSGSPTFALGVFRAPDMPPGAIEGDLASVGAGPLFVDLRSGPRPPAIAEWLDAAQPVRSIGAMHSPTSDRYTIETVALAESYDGFVFVRTSTRAQPTPRMRAKYGEAPAAPPASPSASR